MSLNFSDKPPVPAPKSQQDSPTAAEKVRADQLDPARTTDPAKPTAASAYPNNRDVEQERQLLQAASAKHIEGDQRTRIEHKANRAELQVYPLSVYLDTSASPARLQMTLDFPKPEGTDQAVPLNNPYVAFRQTYAWQDSAEIARLLAEMEHELVGMVGQRMSTPIAAQQPSTDADAPLNKPLVSRRADVNPPSDPGPGARVSKAST